MQTEIPPIPEQTPVTDSLHHKAGSYAVFALLGSFAMNIMTMGVANQAGLTAGRVVSIIVGFIMLSAVPAGVVALLGIRKHGKKKLLWKGLVGTLVPILLIGAAIPAFLTVKKNSTRKIMERAVGEVSKIAPKMIDEATRIDSARISGPQEITIQYTITACSSTELDRSVWANQFVPNVKKNVSKTDFRPLLKLGVTVQLRYLTNDDQLFDQITLTKQDILDPSQP